MEPLTSPLFHHRRKPSILSTGNGMSFSGKDDYGDLLSGGNKKTRFRRGVSVEDYGEIFGACVAGGGRGSSIPVLDLSDLDRANGSGEYRSASNEGQLDYSRIFGGLDGGGGDGDTAAGGVPPYEELFGKVQNFKRDRAKPRATADLGSPMKNPDHGSACLSDAPSQFCDSAKQVNVSYNKTSQPSKDGSNGTTHIAQLNAVPGFTRFVHRDTHQDHDNGIQPKETETNDKRNTIDELSDGKSGRRAKWKLEKEQNVRQASEHILNGKGDTNRNISGVNKRLFHSGEIDVNSLKVPPPSSSPVDQSRPNGKLFFSGELDLKSRPSKVPLSSSSSDQLNDSKVPLHQSKSFAFGSKVDSPEKEKGGYFSPSDEELDVDSAAAISAAALKKAVQQAQESIRLAKEIMERKRDRMKTRSRSALKVKDVKETKHDQHVISVAEKNMKDAFDVLDTKVQVHMESDQKNVRGDDKVVSAVKDVEAILVNRNVEVQKPEENAEAVEGGGMSVWITQVLNNGKNKLAAFASQLADNKNNTSLPEKSEKVEDAEMTKAAVTALETKNREKMDNVASVLRPKAAEREPSTTDSDIDISDSDAFVKDNNLKAQVLDKFEEGGKSEERLDCHETIDVIKLESEKDHPAKKNPKLVGSTDEAKMVFKLEKDAEIHNVVCGFEEYGSRIDAVDTGRNLGEFSQVVDNDGVPNTANGKETDEKKLEDVAEIWSECYSQQETDEQMPIPSQNEVVNQIFSKEECSCEGLDQSTTNKHQYEANDLGHRDAVENQEIDVDEELKDDDFSDGEMDEGRESSKTGAWPDYANENHLDSSFDSHDNDNINVLSKKSELGGHSTKFCTEQVSQLEDCGSVKDNYLAGDAEQACELDGKNSEGNDDLEFEEDKIRVEQEVEEAFVLKESNLCKTSVLKNNEGDDLVREVDEEQVEQAVEDAFKSKKNEPYEESYLDVNNEEGDVLQTSGRENEVSDDIECEVDEKVVEQAVEGAFRLKQKEMYDTCNVDQRSVHGDVIEAIVEHVSEVLASIEERDNVDAATSTDEEIIFEGELPTDVNLLRINAFIHNDSEAHGIDNDRDKDNSIPEKSMPNIEITGVKTRFSIEEEDDHPDFVAGSENATSVHENDVSVDNIMQDVDDAPRKDGEKVSNVEDHQELDLAEKHEEPNLAMPNDSEGCQEHLETDSIMETGQRTEFSEDDLNRTKRESGETREAVQKETERSSCKNDYLKKIEMAMRERERQNRIVVERAIREARERAFAEARERAERASVEKANAEARQRANAAAQKKLGKVPSGTKVSSDKTFSESKLKAERSAVERATAEARERALEKAMSQKSNSEARAPGGKVGTGKSPSVSPESESSGESNNESAQRRKARLERHQRIMERAANALAEKNMRDILAQREQTERNRIAETLDAEIKRWSSGKEGNLRALLSTLQYILGASSGWQPITLTEMLTTSAVKKAYRKATLYVHPDKLQQRGASIQQKYICEKVFDLLQAAWSKLNSEER